MIYFAVTYQVKEQIVRSVAEKISVNIFRILKCYFTSFSGWMMRTYLVQYLWWTRSIYFEYPLSAHVLIPEHEHCAKKKPWNQRWFLIMKLGQIFLRDNRMNSRYLTEINNNQNYSKNELHSSVTDSRIIRTSVCCHSVMQ